MRFHFVFLTAVMMISISSFAASTAQNEAQTPPSLKKPVQVKPESLSIALRVRRVTYEDAYVAVPVTDAILKKNGTQQSVNFDAFVAKAIELSKDKRVEWKVESSTVEAHPVQQQPPKDRKRLDGVSKHSSQQ